MNTFLMIICAVLAICFLVFIHEAGHFLAARAFGVRVTELMLGLRPGVGFTRGGTRYGVTVVLLGGYARVCGMEAGEMSPHLKDVLAALYRRGTATMEDIASDCGISDDAAYGALEELTEWGSCAGPMKKDEFNTYRASAFSPTRKQLRAAQASGDAAPASYELGEARPVPDVQVLFDAEYAQQYRSLPFWKRSIILLSGVAVNLLFAMLAFIVIYSVIGVDLRYPETGEVIHFNADPLLSVQLGINYIVATVQAVAGLFNATAAETCLTRPPSWASSPCRAAFFSQGLAESLFFTALISGVARGHEPAAHSAARRRRFVVEVFQKLTRKMVSNRAMGYVDGGMALFIVFFAVMLNQDIQRILTGFWS